MSNINDGSQKRSKRHRMKRNHISDKQRYMGMIEWVQFMKSDGCKPDYEKIKELTKKSKSYEDIGKNN